jgi:hypothetical protein
MRKLKILKKTYARSQHEYEKYAIVAVSSLYGIELLEDNVKDCRLRLLDTFFDEYKQIFKNNITPKFLNILKIILEKNILCGDALTMKDKNGNPLVFSEWSLPYNDMRLKQKEYEFKNLHTPTLFWSYNTKSDTGEDIMLPNAFKDHPIISYMELKK